MLFEWLGKPPPFAVSSLLHVGLELGRLWWWVKKWSLHTDTFSNGLLDVKIRVSHTHQMPTSWLHCVSLPLAKLQPIKLFALLWSTIMILVEPVSLRRLLKMLNLFVFLPETGKKVDLNYQVPMNSVPTPLGPASCFSAVRLILSERSLSKLASNSLISSSRFPPCHDDHL